MSLLSHMVNDYEERIWRALSDPTRRAILDLLSSGARTTGQLCEAFATTRFAVMKHLEVLVEADLVAIRRRGRERWNHLHAAPLRALHDRWWRRFLTPPARRRPLPKPGELCMEED